MELRTAISTEVESSMAMRTETLIWVELMDSEMVMGTVVDTMETEMAMETVFE